MHRSYNSYNPVASKLLQKRWDEKHFGDHRRAVSTVKPEIDSTPPVTFMHLHLKLKKLQLEEERLATIERDNRILLEKMSHTMRNKGQLDNINTALPKSLSKGRRERELVRISKENMNMLKRIATKKPSISRDMHEKDWRENLHFMSNISSYPEDWYLRNRKTSNSQPNLRSDRSEESEIKPTRFVQPREEQNETIEAEQKRKTPKKEAEPERKQSVKKEVVIEEPKRQPERQPSPKKEIDRERTPSPKKEVIPERQASSKSKISRQPSSKSIKSRQASVEQKTEDEIEDESLLLKEKTKKEDDEYADDFDD